MLSPLGRSRFRSWTLASFPILWVSQDRSPFPCAPQLFPAEDGLAPRPQPSMQEERAQHPVESPLTFSLAFLQFLKSLSFMPPRVALPWPFLRRPGVV